MNSWNQIGLRKKKIRCICLLALFRSRPRVLANDGNRTHEQAELLAQARLYRLPIIGFQISVPQRGSATLDDLGSEKALELALECVKSGADAVKFQVYFADELLISNHPTS